MGDVVCIGSCSGTFYALDRHDGGLAWKQDVRPDGRPTSFHGDPCIAGDMVVIGTDAGTQADRRNAIWAFSAGTGTVRWKAPLDDGIVSDIVPGGSRLFALTRSDTLLCLDRFTGRRLWAFADSGVTDPKFIYRSPAVARGRVFLADEAGRICAFAAQTGVLLWMRRLGSAISTGVLATGNDLVLADARGTIHRLDQVTGVELGNLAAGTIFSGPPVAMTGPVVALAGDDAIACVDLRAGRVLWKHELRLSSSRTYVRQGMVIAATVAGEVLAFRAVDGARLWSRRIDDIIRGIGQDDRTLYLGAQKGMLYAVGAPSPE